ncbi:hypothetical protein T4A_8922 [Trichinella pseudospiralis]|uniref:Uncharacterized protein n=1 Tax=Trichinella pseudospiralis TaxID=6337 RepID=A0A0V1DKR6_TRIPS|nr:hypothetical protein T4A_8922 [Trichinella pseudospiralis]
MFVVWHNAVIRAFFANELAEIGHCRMPLAVFAISLA